MEFNETFLIERDGDGPELLDQDQEPVRLATLHCKECNAVLTDSLSVCGEFTRLDSVMCLKVTSDVVVSREMECGEKVLANCIFSGLTCGQCRCALGKVLHAAPPHLDAARSLFLLHKAHVTCYVLGGVSAVEASAVSFRIEPLVETISETKRQFETLFEHTKISFADSSERDE
ncbi:protein Mis18-beta [Syngnathoides biaculeatus]|uniref:protein Mis18-beta n=1 Tax=Syngnathoides biaculeatus TaxID=300417 RepID=UPI002ADE86B1|nr:protein Mis18-beta [Syngnathoides biaculeatus]